jgi:hypothetical protein
VITCGFFGVVNLVVCCSYHAWTKTAAVEAATSATSGAATVSEGAFGTPVQSPTTPVESARRKRSDHPSTSASATPVRSDGPGSAGATPARRKCARRADVSSAQVDADPTTDGAPCADAGTMTQVHVLTPAR